MKKLHRLLVTIIAGVCLTTQVRAQNTSFAYSGELKENSNPVTGIYDFRFTLYGSASGNQTIGSPLQVPNVSVGSGQFTLMLDFGDVFDGSERWLEIQVRPNQVSPPPFTTLTPRVQIAATPYAVTAQSVSGDVAASQITGTLNTASLADGAVDTTKIANGAVDSQKLVNGAVDTTKLANGAVDTTKLADGAVDSQKLANGTVDITKLAAGVPSSGQVLTFDGTALAWTFMPTGMLWSITGNAGTSPNANFLGTTDNNDLMLRVNNLQALRVLPDRTVRNDQGSAPPEPIPASPNLVGGYSGNTISADARGATIAGGGGLYDHVFHSTSPGWNEIGQAGDFSFIGSGSANYLKGPHNSIVGGHYNRIIDANYSLIAGGGENFIGAPVDAGAIVAGVGNTLSNLADTAFIGAGHNNTVSNTAAFIGAGGFNLAGGEYSVVTGGTNNLATGFGATIPGGKGNGAAGVSSFAAGQQAKAMHDDTFVWSDGNNNQDFASTGPNQFLIHAQGGVGINLNNPSEALEVAGNVKATLFIGDGSQLTGVGGGTVADGSITAPKLADSAVTTVKVADGAIATAKLNDLAVTAGKLADDSVTTTKLPNATITTAKLVDGSVTAAKLSPANPAAGQVLSYDGSALAWTTPSGGGSGWSLTGNSGTTSANFLGTTDNKPLEVRVFNTTALRITPSSAGSIPNIIGGAVNNVIDPAVYGSVIAGGGNNTGIAFNSIYAGNSFIGSGDQNSITGASTSSGIMGGHINSIGNSSAFAAISGGQNNTIGASSGSGSSFIGGGEQNVIASGSVNVIAGGQRNRLQGAVSTIGGGQFNLGFGNYTTIAGGSFNTNTATSGSIGGGERNFVSADYGTIPGGLKATVRSVGQMAYASGAFTVNGDAQASLYVLRTTTISTSPTELGSGDTPSGLMTMPLNSAWTFDILVVASSSGTGPSAGYQIRGVARRAPNGIVSVLSSIAPTVLYADAGAISWAVNVVGDGTGNGYLHLLATSGAGVNWVANVRTVEVIK